MDIQKEIPFNIFDEIEPIGEGLVTIEDCFYTSDAGNMSLHLLTTENEGEYYIQRCTADGKAWFKCTDVGKLREII